MNMNNIRLDDKLNTVTLATIVAIALSIGSALVSVAMDTNTSETAQTVASVTVAAVH